MTDDDLHAWEGPDEWHAVPMRAPDFTALGSALTRKGTFPTADYGTRCLCCNVETETRLRFDPSASHASSAIALPACKDCLPHIQKGNHTAFVTLGLLCVGVLLCALADKNGAWLWVPGIACFVAMAANYLLGKRTRDAMARRGHRNGLEVVAIPGLVSVRTTNPRFARELRERNPELVKR